MVDVSDKPTSLRIARASGRITALPETIDRIKQGQILKGDVLAVAQVAGIMAAKQTAQLIPMCHPVMLSGVDLSFEMAQDHLTVRAEVKTTEKTGVEMEALQAVTSALLTIYDMVKAIDKTMTIGHVQLDYKSGGRSGLFARGKVLSVNSSLEKGVVKQPLDEAEFVAGHGVAGDAHAGDWHRQVSLLAIESYRKMEDNHPAFAIGSFAENLTTEGIVLYELPIGTILEIGETLQRVTQIGKACHKGCAIKQTVGDCVMPREGIFTEVLQGGLIRPGDTILVRPDMV